MIPWYAGGSALGFHLLQLQVDEKSLFRHVVIISDRVVGESCRILNSVGVSLFQSLVRPKGRLRGGPYFGPNFRARVI